MSASRLDPHGGELAVGVGGQLDVLDLAAALDGGQRVLAALLVPAHRRRRALRRAARHEQLLGVDVELRAEAAADRGRDDPQLVLGDAERDRHHDLEDVRDLRRRVERDVAAERLRHHAHAAGLHRHRDQALLDVALLDRVGGVARTRASTASGSGIERPTCSDVLVPRSSWMTTRSASASSRSMTAVERLVVDDDGVDRVLRPASRCRRGRRPRRRRRSTTLSTRERVVRRVLHVVGDRPRARHRRGPASRRSAPVSTATTPGIAERAARVDRR